MRMDGKEAISSINEIYKKLRVPLNLQMHMMRAAAAAELICDNWNGPAIKKADVIAALLLHDIGNIVKMNLKTEDGLKMDLEYGFCPENDVSPPRYYRVKLHGILMMSRLVMRNYAEIGWQTKGDWNIVIPTTFGRDCNKLAKAIEDNFRAEDIQQIADETPHLKELITAFLIMRSSCCTRPSRKDCSLRAAS